jgi:hypothetical protein
VLNGLARPISLGALMLGGIGAAFAPNPAHAALGADQSISVTNVEYACKTDNNIVNVSVGGPKTFRVSARASVPSSVDSGDTIPSTSATLDLQMPYTLMDKVRGLGVKSIAGSADANVTLEGVDANGTSVGTMNVPVNNLAAADQNVPSSGAMTIGNVQGTVTTFTAPTFPSGNGLVYVELPLYFKLHAVLTPPVLNSIANVDLDCYRTEASDAKRVIGTIKVGSGCSTSACPLPGSDRSSIPAAAKTWITSTPAWADPATTPSTSASPSASSSPSAGTSTAPGGTTTTSTGGTTTGSHSGGSSSGSDDDSSDGSSDDTTETAATTALPDTGSPVKPWLFGVLGLALAARIALFARRRVARAGSSRRAL